MSFFCACIAVAVLVYGFVPATETTYSKSYPHAASTGVMPVVPPLETKIVPNTGTAPSMPPPLKPTPLPLPPTKTSPPFGLSVADTLTGLSSAELQKTLDDFQALHVEWVRLDFDWSVIQRRNSATYDWSNLDRVIALLHGKNFNVLAILVYTPPWARGGECMESNRCPPEDSASFAHFAQVAVKRYAAKGVHTWEIWNEPNMQQSWMPAANPAQYVSLLKEASARIRSIDPTAHIITGGLGAIDSKNGNIAPRDFLSALYDEGAQGHFDAIAFHPYSFPALPSYGASWNAWQQMANTSPSLRSIMMQNGDSDKKIWITEYGAPTGGPGSATSGYVPGEDADHVTEGYQAAILEDALRETTKGDVWAGPLFWYSYKDLGTSESTENFYGLRRADGSHKPAYDALLK